MDRRKNAIIGAAVADAASMGLHWLYDQGRLRQVAQSEPEFRAPSTEDYADAPGYFAHAGRVSGDFSQYGEQMMTMLRSMVSNQWRYSKSRYENEFKDFFGYGGAYVGYIDHPTRETLDNITIAEQKALEEARQIPFDGEETLKHKLITKVLANVKQASVMQLDHNELTANVEKAVRLTDDHDDIVEHAFKILNALSSISGYHGTDDRQLPALSKLPPLVAVYAGHNDLQTVVESAVRVTHNNDFSVQCAAAISGLIESVIQTGDIPLAIDDARKNCSPQVRAFFEQALTHIDRDTPSVTAEWGMACELKLGVPSLLHNITRASSFTEAVRQNIWSGGDSCGRSIVIGAVMGAAYGINGSAGIPQSWIEKLTQKPSLSELLEDFSASVV